MAKKTKKKPVKKVAPKKVKKAAPKKAKKATAKKAKPAAKKKTAAKPKAKKSAPKKKAAKKAPAKKAAAPKKTKKVAAKKAAPVVVKPQMAASAYINFNGNCEEAFNFYKSVFGGEFGYLGRFSEVPAEEGQPPMPEEVKNKIMHVSLTIGKTVLMGSDVVEGFGPPYKEGNNFSVMLDVTSKSEADHYFSHLSKNGHVGMPIMDTFWNAYFGACTDQFGINWMVSYSKPM